MRRRKKRRSLPFSQWSSWASSTVGSTSLKVLATWLFSFHQHFVAGLDDFFRKWGREISFISDCCLAGFPCAASVGLGSGVDTPKFALELLNQEVNYLPLGLSLVQKLDNMRCNSERDSAARDFLQTVHQAPVQLLGAEA